MRPQPQQQHPWLPLNVVHGDVDVVLEVQRWKRSLPQRLQSVLERTMSPHPLHDLSVVVWMVLLAGLPFAGYPLLWNFFATFLVCMALAYGVQATVPRQIDSRVSSRAQISPSGFPVVEVVLAAVIFMTIAQVPLL
jgi:hypothetical protein